MKWAHPKALPAHWLVGGSIPCVHPAHPRVEKYLFPLLWPAASTYLNTHGTSPASCGAKDLFEALGLPGARPPSMWTVSSCPALQDPDSIRSHTSQASQHVPTT